MDGKIPFLIRLAKLTYGKIVCAGGRVRLKNTANADLNKGPYLFLVNHTGAQDSLMVSALLPRHVRWVAGAYLFKNPFLRLILAKGCTAIPKQQGRRDPTMLRNMLAAVKEGDSVGINPEGTRTWDGDMAPVNWTALAKFIRHFRIPALFIHLEGGFAIKPRWADFKRKGVLTVNVRHMLTPQQISQMQLPQLVSTVERYMSFSNDEWKRTAKYEYAGDRRAEGLQRLFYLCPRCRGIDTFRTEGKKITCTSCGAGAVLDDKDDLVSETIRFRTLAQWHGWESREIGSIATFPPEKGVLLQTGDDDNNGKLHTVSKQITVSVSNWTIHVDCSNGRHFDLPFDDITSLILNAKQTMELFCNNILYRIRLEPNANSLKYQELFNSYRNMKEAAV